MADLIVSPSLQLKETDILTVDKLNLMAVPVVSLAVATPVTDENFFRNGNFYSSFWTTPAGLSCPVGVETSNANYWSVNPNGAAVNCLRSTDVPDLYSLWSMEIDGAPNVTTCSVGQQINGDLSATLRRPCTWSGYIENNSGGLLSPTLEIWTANVFNNFAACTLQTTVNLQTVAVGTWAYDTVTIDLSQSAIANVANGLLIKVRLPSGALSSAAYRINFSRLKFQLGEVATQFVDDPSLFLQTPSIDSTMLQDGCIARPTLFLPHVVPKGAYVAGSIQSADIGAGQVAASNLASGAAAGNLGYTPVNKAGDSGVGPLEFTLDTPVNAGAGLAAAVYIETTSANGPNDAVFPAIGFWRPGVVGKALGLSKTNRFKTIDSSGNVGYLLDTQTGVDTNSYQPGSITLAALAQSLVNLIIPVGMVRMFAGPNVPAGWLVCDGSWVSRNQYGALFTAIGTYWGPGDNLNYFNLPDFRGRSPLGYVNSAVGGITGRGFASYGGEESHPLSVGELAYHNHALTDGQHAHGVTQTPHQHSYVYGLGSAISAAPGSQTCYQPGGTYLTSGQNANVSINSSGANISIAPEGSNAAHNNMQPFAVLYFIIKY